MAKVIFLNATQHELSTKQIERAKEKYEVEKVKNLKDINPVLFNKLKNTPIEINMLKELVEEFISLICDEYYKNIRVLYIHLPIGSPAFNYLLANELKDFNVHVVFSQSERKVIEIIEGDKTVKKSIFEFIDYIQVQ